MEAFTIKQAKEVLKKHFAGHQIIEAHNTRTETSIYFKDAQGRKWELLSNEDPYFQDVEKFVIYEVS
jgi:hypothetical protein